MLVAGLDARTDDPSPLAALDRCVTRLAPERVHVHTVVNPSVLAWAVSQAAVMTVQDHRYFCPTRGKWTLDGQVCRAPMAPEHCASCFEDHSYFESILALTHARLAALRGLRIGVLSHYMRAELLAMGLAPDHVVVTPPWVDWPRPPTAPVELPAWLPSACVLVAGRLTASKGLWDALAAWRLAQLELPLVCAGTGPLRAALEAQGVTVTGWLARDSLAALYARSRALLFAPRWQEPFGIVGLEALSHGVPVVAWDSGGVREWHPGGELLVPWGDVPGLARALGRALGQRAEPASGFTRAAGLAAVDLLYARRG